MTIASLFQNTINISSLRRLTVLCFCFFFFIHTNAQENYQPAYIIDLDHDTIFGQIDYRNWKYNPKAITFKPNTSEESKSYAPGQMLRFGVVDEIYISATVEMEISSALTGDLQYDPVMKFETVNVFLHTLFEGGKNLFHLYSENGIENFYIGPSSSPQLLGYKRYLKVEEGDKDLAKENRRYMGQLYNYLQDCSEIDKQIEKTDYDKLSLAALFGDYYKCSNSELTFRKKPEKTLFKFGLVAGAARSTLIFEGEYQRNISDTPFEPSQDLLGGLFLELVFPRNLRKWSLYNELQYSSYLYEGNFTGFDLPDYYSGSTTQLGASYLKLTNLFRFNYPFEKITLSIGMGFSNDVSLKVTNSYTHTTVSYGYESTRESSALQETRDHQQGIVIGAGIRYNHFLFESRYQWGNGMSPYVNLQSKTRMLTLLLGYRFN